MRFTIRQMMAWTIVRRGHSGGARSVCPDIIALPLMGLFMMSMPVDVDCGDDLRQELKRTFFIGALIATSPILTFIMFYGPMMLMGVSVRTGLDVSDIGELTYQQVLRGCGCPFFAGLNGAIAMGVALAGERTKPTGTGSDHASEAGGGIAGNQSTRNGSRSVCGDGRTRCG